MNNIDPDTLPSNPCLNALNDGLNDFSGLILFFQKKENYKWLTEKLTPIFQQFETAEACAKAENGIKHQQFEKGYNVGYKQAEKDNNLNHKTKYYFTESEKEAKRAQSIADSKEKRPDLY